MDTRLNPCAACLLAVMLCSSGLSTAADTSGATDAPTEAAARDPYEGFNRAMFRFNEQADRYVLQPTARTYRKITPQPVRSAVSNFFNNLRDVKSFGSNVLRGDARRAGYDFMRVAVNTTFGLGGLIDIAGEAGMPDNKNTLGDTFATWGWQNSHYLVLPLVGPTTVRDGIGSTIGTLYSVEGALFARPAIRYTLAATDAVNTREKLLGVTETLDTMALDSYVATRETYMAYRRKQLGQTLPDADEELFDPEAQNSSSSAEGQPENGLPDDASTGEGNIVAKETEPSAQTVVE